MNSNKNLNGGSLDEQSRFHITRRQYSKFWDTHLYNVTNVFHSVLLISLTSKIRLVHDNTSRVTKIPTFWTMFAKVHSRHMSDILASFCQEYPSSGNTSMLHSADTRVGGFQFTFQRLPNSGQEYVRIIHWNGPRQITSRPFQSPPLLPGQHKNRELHRFLVQQMNYYYFCEVLITEVQVMEA